MEIFDSASQEFGAFLPRLAAAVVVLVVGIIAARMLSRMVTKVLDRAGLDRLAERWGSTSALRRVGVAGGLASLVGTLAKVVVLFLTIIVAVSVLGLPALNDAISEAILFLPRFLVATAILAGGVIVSGAIREQIDRVTEQMDVHGPVGLLVQAVIMVATVIVAASMVGIPTLFLILLATTCMAGIALTGALAFGLGSRGVVDHFTAGRYISEQVRVGDHVRVGDVGGRVHALTHAAVVLDAGDGRLLRVPNRHLLDQVVEVVPAPTPIESDGPPEEGPPGGE